MNSDKLDVDDVFAIRNCCTRLRELNTKQYGEPSGIEVNRKVAERAEEVADKIERRLAA